ncbi:MAG: NusG domain II-containing protein [Solobacterium sp.]|nr:NusG domain II-containing protein [Solobacterium sp.]
MKKKEWIVLLVIGGIALIGILALQILGKMRAKQNQALQSTYVVDVFVDDKVVETFDPNENATYTIEGNYGLMEIEVKEGQWHVSHVECPNHICEKMGWKTVDDIEPIVCLPNGIQLLARVNGN